MKTKQSFVILSALLLGSFAAQGSIIINTDQSASGSLGIVQLNNGETGTLVTGLAPGGAVLNFEGNESLVVPSGGQARVEAEDGEFTQIDIYFATGLLFDRMVFNLDATVDGDVNISAWDQFGNQFDQLLAVSGSGQNFVNVESDAVQQIARVFVSAEVPLSFADLAQVRVGGIDDGTPGGVIPEPATFTLMGLGLIGAALGRRYLKRSR